MVKAKIYDYNGPIMDIDPFWDFLKDKYPELYHNYKVIGDKDQSIKLKHRPQVLGLYDEALNKGLFPAVLIPNAAGRLEKDVSSGYTPFIFTTVPLETVVRQAEEMGITQYFPGSNIITVAQLAKDQKLAPNLQKEDPAMYIALMRYLRGRDVDSFETYVDDAEKRVMAAHKANEMSAENRIQRLYLFNKTLQAPDPVKPYKTINDVMMVE